MKPYDSNCQKVHDRQDSREICELQAPRFSELSTEICNSTRKIARDKQSYQSRATVYGTATCIYDI